MVPVTQRPIRVLLVEHDDDDPERPAGRLDAAREAGLDVEWTDHLTRGLERLSQGGIDVVLLDLTLPDSEGIVTFERTYAFAPDVPIVVMTEVDDESLAMSAVQGGAQDYLVKTEAEGRGLVRALRYAIERHRLLSALRSLSLIDDLTGLYNRRGFADLGEQYLKLSRRSAQGITLVYLDLDRFKTINDTLGHHVGDRALLKVAEILKAAFRRSDIIARMGGDEFAVLALESSGDSAEMLLERLRERLAEFNRSNRQPYQLSVSLGMARCDGEERVRLDELLSRADAAMYEEKRSKRKAALR